MLEVHVYSEPSINEAHYFVILRSGRVILTCFTLILEMYLNNIKFQGPTGDEH